MKVIQVCTKTGSQCPNKNTTTTDSNSGASGRDEIGHSSGAGIGAGYGDCGQGWGGGDGDGVGFSQGDGHSICIGDVVGAGECFTNVGEVSSILFELGVPEQFHRHFLPLTTDSVLLAQDLAQATTQEQQDAVLGIIELGIKEY